MLQRAASNAYSWWWASHIRTKQGKWLEQNLQDMEEKVKNILIVIEEDADSFAKRAEMYYKKRPELINFVEESYRAYRALAERYNHISGELQNANNTIATVFPGQVPISMEEEEDVDNEPKVSTTNTINVPKTPEHPKFKVPARAMKKPLPRKPKKPEPKKLSSNMTKEAAQEEVDKLQKGILVLQTKKEFMVSSYESGLANLWDIEEQIEEMQEKVCELQDEFGISKVIEDNDARALMTASALKSCEETLVQLQEQQNRSMKEARIEAERIKDAEDRLKAFKDGFLQNHTDDRKLIEESNAEDSVNRNFVEELSSLNQKRSELHFISEKIKEYFEINSDSSLNVAELAEKVDELVDKVLSLENALSSQTALINRLRLETDELQKHLQSLEDCKSSLIDDSKILNNKIRELEEELNGVQDLNHSVKDESNKLQTHFTEVCRNLDDLSEELQSPIQQVDAEITDPPQVEETDRLDVVPNKDTEKEENMMTPVNGLPLPSSNSEIIGPGETEGTQEKEVRSESFPGLSQQDVQNMGSSQEEDNVLNVGGDSPKWQQLFLSGLEDREKILLTEYTSILRNYKEVKKRLSEMENKSQESLSETTAQLRELKNANAMKDAEIRSMRQKLDILQASLDQNKDSHLKKSDQSVQYKAESTIEQWKYLFSNLQGKSSGQSNLRRLEDLLREQDEMSAFTSKENPHSEEEIKEALVAEQHPALTVEEKFRRDIDELLEENLEFWLRFSNSFHQIKKFQTAVQDLQTEFKKLKNDDKKQEGNANAADQASKSEAPPLEKRLKELQTELSFWLEQNASLKDELQRRLLSLSNIQEEIARALKMHSETEKSEFTAQQAAKFQGEVLNMQQENDKVANELQVGLDHVRRLQLEIDKTVSSQLSGSKSSRHHNPNMRHATTRTKVPLRYFIFGVKPKKPSLFSCISPALQKQYSDLRAAGAGPPIEK